LQVGYNSGSGAATALDIRVLTPAVGLEGGHMMLVTGTCPLCREENVHLCRSHLELPRFVYKDLRSAKGAPNPNPVHLTEDSFEQSPKQNWRRLLCRKCENDRFNVLGETHVAKISLKADGRFGLYDMLRQLPRFGRNQTRYFDTTGSRVPHAALAYFAVSMLWRAQYIEGATKPIKLGPYEPAIRAYLLNGCPAPRDVSVVAIVRNTRLLSQLSHGVHFRAKGNGHIYALSIPGITFHITVGDHRSDATRTGCLLHYPKKLILESLIVEDALEQQAVRMAQRAGVK
jgi:hypothetical protein